MKKLLVSLAFYLSLTVAAISLSSCNTYIGLGKDFQKLGHGIQNTGYGRTWEGENPSAQQPSAQDPVPTQ